MLDYWHDTNTIYSYRTVIITFRVSRRRREMYMIARLCVCLLSLGTFPHYFTDTDVTWGNGRGCPLVVHYSVDLQSVQFRCYNITVPNVKCQRKIVLESLYSLYALLSH